MQWSEQERAALAPTGVLRAAINLGNPVLAAMGQDGLAPQGVSVDLAHALASALQMPLQLVVRDGAGKAVEAVAGGAADIGFFAIDPVRAAGVRFTAPYLLIEGAYLVREDSPIGSMDEVDRRAIRVAVGRGSAYDLFLTRTLRHAQIVRTATSPAVVDGFLAEGLDVAAGVRQQLESDAARLGGLRLLPGRFMVIEQAMGLPGHRPPQALALLARFVAHARSAGWVRQALERHRITGARIAP